MYIFLEHTIIICLIMQRRKYVKSEEEKQAIAPFISGVSSAALSLG